MKDETVVHLKLSRGLVIGAILVVGLVLSLATASMVFAQSDQMINGCVSKKKGALRVVDSADSCTSKETPISWSQEGPKGETGPPGPDGGDAGTLDGKDSADFAAADHSHPAIVRRATRAFTSGEFIPEFVKMCQPGERATGGGGGIVDGADRTRTVNQDPDFYYGPVSDDSLANGEVQRSFPVDLHQSGLPLPAGDGDTPEGWGLSIRNEAPMSRTAEVWVICTSP